MPFFPKYNLLFLHVPKTGGTSVENTLQEIQKQEFFDWEKSKNQLAANQLRWQKQNIYGYILVEGKEFALQHATFSQMQGWLYFTNKQPTVLMVVRNPYSRMVSEYKWQLLFGYVGSFANFVTEAFTKQWHRQTQIFHQHLLPQSDFSKGVENIFIVYFEHLQEGMQHFFQVMAEQHDDFKTAVLRRDNETIENCKHTAVAAESKKPWRSYYINNTRIIKMVQDMYAEDFVQFGYSKLVDAEE